MVPQNDQSIRSSQNRLAVNRMLKAVWNLGFFSTKVSVAVRADHPRDQTLGEPTKTGELKNQQKTGALNKDGDRAHKYHK